MSTVSTVYVETTIVSYLTARRSRDAILAAHQALTREWWRGRAAYHLRVSQLVIDESGAAIRSCAPAGFGRCTASRFCP